MDETITPEVQPEMTVEAPEVDATPEEPTADDVVAEVVTPEVVEAPVEETKDISEESLPEMPADAVADPVSEGLNMNDGSGQTVNREVVVNQ